MTTMNALRVIRFTVPAVPVAQPRARATNFNGHARVHEQTTIKNATTGERRPHPILAFKATVRHAFAASYAGAPLSGPLRVDVTFVLPRLSNQIWKTRPMLRQPKVGGGDLDNLLKGLFDALNELAWGDDGQIAFLGATKWIASGDEQPHVAVTIREVRT